MSSVTRIRTYIDSYGIKKSEFYQKTGLSNGYLDKVKELGADKIESIISAYPDIDLYWLITGKKGNTPLIPLGLNSNNGENEGKPQQVYGELVTENVTPTVTPTLKKEEKAQEIEDKNARKKGVVLPFNDINYNLGVPKIITVNERQEENIIYVPVKARAGYLLGYGDAEYMQTLPTLRLPGLNNATYRMFEVSGPSMAPNIISGDRAIGQWVGSLDEIRDNRVHIVVTKTDGVVIKRVLNRIEQRGKIVLKSDTISHRKEHPTYEIDPSEILEIWYCRLKLSSDFSEPAEVYHRLNDLESDMLEVKQILTSLVK